MLSNWNTHTRGGNDSQHLVMTDPFAQANGGRTEISMTLTPRAQQAPGTDGQPPTGNDQQRSAFDQQQALTPGGQDKDLKDGVVKLHVTLPGSSAPGFEVKAEGSGFLVNTKGDAGPSKPGEQLVATADHVVEDRNGEIYKTGHNLFDKKSDLSMKDFFARSSELLSQQDAYKGPLGVAPSKRDEMGYEMDYIRDHFKDISKVSAQVNPGAKGITEEGLAEYRREHTKIDAETAAGSFSGSIADRDPGTDLAVVRLSGLTPDQQAHIGHNQEFETTPLKDGDQLTMVGAKKTASGPIQGLQQWKDMGDTAPGIIIGTYDAEKGMSGGPARAVDHKVVGVNHAKDHGVGNIISVEELRPILQEIEARKIPYRRMLH